MPALSGMGSSSSFTVGLCNILKYLQNQNYDSYDLAYDAIEIEQKKIKEFVGSQDQTFASFGGFNKIEFEKTGNIKVIGLNISLKNRKLLEESSLLVFTGKVRMASRIEERKIKKLNKISNRLNHLNELVDESFSIINNEKLDIMKLGKLLDKSWKIKKQLSKEISTKYLDKIYDIAIKNGAYGGKLLGAGGGGFIFYVIRKKKSY